MKKSIVALTLVIGAALSACGSSQCGPGTQDVNGTCVSSNQGDDDDEDDD